MVTYRLRGHRLTVDVQTGRFRYSCYGRHHLTGTFDTPEYNIACPFLLDVTASEDLTGEALRAYRKSCGNIEDVLETLALRAAQAQHMDRTVTQPTKRASARFVPLQPKQNTVR